MREHSVKATNTREISALFTALSVQLLVCWSAFAMPARAASDTVARDWLARGLPNACAARLIFSFAESAALSPVAARAPGSPIDSLASHQRPTPFDSVLVPTSYPSGPHWLVAYDAHGAVAGFNHVVGERSERGVVRHSYHPVSGVVSARFVSFATRRGLRLGSSRADIERVFGPPRHVDRACDSQTLGYRELHEDGPLYTYTFMLSHDRVVLMKYGFQI
jgi:hypothetical protein